MSALYCCITLEVVQGQDAITGAKDAQSHIFTTYHIEEYPLDGRVHYTSMDGRKAIAYSNGRWRIRGVKIRY